MNGTFSTQKNISTIPYLYFESKVISFALKSPENNRKHALLNLLIFLNFYLIGQTIKRNFMIFFPYKKTFRLYLVDTKKKKILRKMIFFYMVSL